MTLRRPTIDLNFVKQLAVEPVVGILLFVITQAAAWSDITLTSSTIAATMLAACCFLPWQPWPALALATVCFGAWSTFHVPGVSMSLCGGIFVYSWFRHRHAGRWLVAVICPAMMLSVWVMRYGWDDFLANVFFVGSIALFSAIVGATARRRSSAEERVRQESAAALRATRLRMASELHDSVAQTQTLVVMNLEDLVEHPRLPGDLASEVMETLELSRQAATELRAAMAALRNVDQDFGTFGRPSGHSLDDQWRHVVSALVDGGFDATTHFDLNNAQLSPELAHTASRILGELVTNLMWHGAPGPCSITVQQRDDQLLMHVINNIGSSPPVKAGGGGQGLLGVKERVDLHNGSCTFGQHGSTWHAVVQLPLTHASGERA